MCHRQSDSRNFGKHDVVKDLPIRLDKTSHDDLTKLANEFRLFKGEMQQQITSLREHYLEIQKDTHLPKSTSNLDFSALTHGSGIQYKMGW